MDSLSWSPSSQSSSTSRGGRQLGKLKSPKQESFCQEYLVDKNATKAAERAGYSVKTAQEQSSRLLSNAIIKNRVEELLAAQEVRTEITADYVLTTIVDTIERCKQARPVKDQFGKPVLVETEDGDIVPAYAFDSRAVLKGAELLGKHKKLWVEKHEHSGPDGKPIEVNNPSALTDAQLDAMIDAKLSKTKGKPNA